MFQENMTEVFPDTLLDTMSTKSMQERFAAPCLPQSIRGIRKSGWVFRQDTIEMQMNNTEITATAWKGNTSFSDRLNSSRQNYELGDYIM